MLAVTWPGMLLSLIPIVFVEAWILKSRLPLDTRGSLRLALLANLASTIVGIPIAWLLSLALEMVVSGGGKAMGMATPWRKFFAVTIQAPWLVPYGSELYWLVPAAALALLPAYFLASWLMEYKIMQALLPKNPGSMVRRAAFSANLGSYAILAVVTACWLGISLSKGKPPDGTSWSRSQTAQRIRVEFRNPTPRPWTVEIRIGAEECAANPVVHTQEIMGSAGWALSDFAEINQRVCYRARETGANPDSWGDWRILNRTAPPHKTDEAYQVTIP